MGSSYREILVSELLARKRVNTGFSLRAFARDLEMSPSHLSAVIRGKKGISHKQAGKIISRLTLSPNDKFSFLASAFPDIIHSRTTRESEKRLLEEDEFQLISEWYHFAILSLGTAPRNQAHPEWIARKLGIREIEALDGLNRLKRLGLIAVYKDGSFKKNENVPTTSDDIPSEAIRKAHKQVLNLAQLRLDDVPVEEREFGTIIMNINPAKLEKAKKMIRRFQNELWDELGTGKKKDLVYILSLQLFPVNPEIRRLP